MLSSQQFNMREWMRLGLVFITCSATIVLYADEFYLGIWKIDSAVVGPWWTDKNKPDPSEMKLLVGKTVTIKAKEIVGPRQVVCKHPHYQVKQYPADMLFQGAFGEMHERDKSVDPAKVATVLGFKGTTWKTLETGCGNELDFHFLDANTTTFALNNYVYVLKRQ